MHGLQSFVGCGIRTGRRRPWVEAPTPRIDDHKAWRRYGMISREGTHGAGSIRGWPG